MGGGRAVEYVQLIRVKEKIETIKKVLKSGNFRDYALFVLGINSGLRISDLLKLKVEDVLDEWGKHKDRITLREKKTGKEKNFPLGKTVSKALDEYLDGRQYVAGDWLFPSRQRNKPLSRQQTYNIINSAARTRGHQRADWHTHPS